MLYIRKYISISCSHTICLILFQLSWFYTDLNNLFKYQFIQCYGNVIIFQIVFHDWWSNKSLHSGLSDPTQYKKNTWKCNSGYLFCVVPVSIWFHQNRLRSRGSLLRSRISGIHCLVCATRGSCSFISPVLWPEGICKQAISLPGKDGRAAKAVDLSQILRWRMKAWTWILGMVAVMPEWA